MVVPSTCYSLQENYQGSVSVPADYRNLSLQRSERVLILHSETNGFPISSRVIILKRSGILEKEQDVKFTTFFFTQLGQESSTQYSDPVPGLP